MIFDEILKMMTTPNQTALDMSLSDCHVDGLFSLVVGGEKDESTGKLKHGTLTRVFVATKKIKPFDIQFHSHRYGLKIGVIDGVFEHHVAYPYSVHDGIGSLNTIKMKAFHYKSPLNGGTGLEYVQDGNFKLESYKIPKGGEVFLESYEIHSVSCSKGSVWIVQEQGFDCDHSVVLGTSFQTEGLYNTPKQFQTNDIFTLVYDKLKKLLG